MHKKNTSIPELLHSQNRKAWLDVWVDPPTEQMDIGFSVNGCNPWGKIPNEQLTKRFWGFTSLWQTPGTVWIYASPLKI